MPMPAVPAQLGGKPEIWESCVGSKLEKKWGDASGGIPLQGEAVFDGRVLNPQVHH